VEVGDLVTAVVHIPRPGRMSAYGVQLTSGVILKIEQNTEPDDGSFEPVITLFTSNGMISIQGRQIATVDRRAKNCQ
jgi:hypothetical protein